MPASIIELPLHFEDIGRFLVADEIFIERHRIGQFLVGRGGKAGGHRAEDRQARQEAPGEEPTRRLLGQEDVIDEHAPPGYRRHGWSAIR